MGPIPGSKIGSCPDLSKCFVHTHGRRDASLEWSPPDLPKEVESNPEQDSFRLPLVVQLTEKIVFPFCVARGQELEAVNGIR